MSTLASSANPAGALKVRVTDRTLIVDLVDGRTVSVPIAWYPRLAEATPQERRAFVLLGPGIGIHWPGIDEDISVEALLQGLASGESAASLRRWRLGRKHRANGERRSASRKTRRALPGRRAPVANA